MTEWNHECGFRINTENERYIKPKTMNESLEIFLSIYEHEDNLIEYLSNTTQLPLDDYEVLINEAINYTYIDKYKVN